MLEIRPNCEHCAKDLPPEAPEARICSFECTFCQDCAEHLLEGICPNCGGNFVPRPVRPAVEFVAKTFLGSHPASLTRVLKPVDLKAHAALMEQVLAVGGESPGIDKQ